MPVFEVTGPDGRKFDVDAPEGSSRDDAIAYIAGTYYTGAADTESSAGAGTHLMSGTNEGIAGMLDTPARLAEALFIEAPQALVRKVTAGEANYNTDLLTKQGNSSLARAILENTVSKQEPKDELERAARSGGKLLGENLPLMIGTTGAAMNRATDLITNKVIPKTASAFSMLLDDASMNMARSPMASLFGEGAAAITAGATGQAVDEAGGNRAVGEFIGGLAPSVMGRNVIDAGKGAVKVAAGLLPGNLRTRQAKNAADEVSRVLGGSLEGESGARLEVANELREEMPGFNPSLAQSTKSEALRNQQIKIERGLSGGSLEDRIVDYKNSEQAINQYIKRVAPNGSPDPTFVVNAGKRRIGEATGRAERALGNVQSQKESLAEGIPRVDRALEGQRQRNMIDSAKIEKREAMAKIANNFGINSATNPIDARKLKSILKANKAIIPESKLADKKNIPAAVRDFLAVDGSFTFQDIKALRERVVDDLIDAQRSTTGSRVKVRALTAMKKEIDDFLDESFSSGPLAENYRKFREIYLKEYIQPFEQGAAFEVGKKGATGTYRLFDEESAGAFFQPGDISSARQYKQIFGEQAEGNIRPFVLDSLSDYTTRDGVIDGRRLAEWTRKHATVLEEFPGIKKQVGNIRDAAEGLLSRQAQLEGRRRSIEDSELNIALKKLGKLGVKDQSVIDTAISDPRVMRQLASAARKSPAATASLRRNVWEKVSSGNSDEINKFIDDNGKSLRLLFDDSHLRNLKKIQEAKGMLEFVPQPKGSAAETNLRNRAKKELGLNLSEMTGSYIAVQRGRSNKLTEVARSLSGLVIGRNQKSIDALFELALYDPEVARTLINERSFRRGGGYTDRAKNYLNGRMLRLGRGVVIRATGTGEREIEQKEER